MHPNEITISGGKMLLLASHLLSGPASPDLYLDPGSGSVLLQILIATIIGLSLVVRTQWSKIKSLFKGKNVSEDDTDDEE